MTRPSKDEYYLEIAKAVCQRGTCLRRNFGAVIVNKEQIISTGYSGSPRGALNCCDIGRCERQELGIPSGQRYEICRSVHAEANAIIHASRDQMTGGTLYLFGEETGSDKSIIAVARPCQMCRRLIINAGITKVVIKTPDGFKIEFAQDYTKDLTSKEGF